MFSGWLSCQRGRYVEYRSGQTPFLNRYAAAAANTLPIPGGAPLNVKD